MRVTLTVNGRRHDVDGVRAEESLLHLIRDRLGLTGTKNACEEGRCGACTVALDGTTVCACVVPAAQAHESTVRTVEGLSDGAGRPAPIQQAFMDAGAIQCGFCTPGMLVQAEDLLRRIPDPDDAEIRTALGGNLCRCTGYAKIIDAVRLAAGSSRAEAAR
jgi:carbon-monoxide dehydrogenase small subunit